MIEVKVPERPFLDASITHSVFLAGSIEQGTAYDWQSSFSKELADVNHVVLYNPRRDHWDPTWEQSDNNEQFIEQVSWELEYLEKADLIAMYFDHATKSPVTLLELGLYATSGKLIVCCPEGFWRKGNVDFICNKFHIEQVNHLGDLVEATKMYVAREPQ